MKQNLDPCAIFAGASAKGLTTMNMSLYEIDARIRLLVNPETGEVGDYNRLMELYEDRQEAVENLALLIKEKTALLNAVTMEKKALELRRQELERAVERLTCTLEDALGEDSGFETARVKVSTRRTNSVEIEDDGDVFRWLDSHYGEWKDNYEKPYKEERKLSKKGLAFLMLDHDIPGVKRVTGRSVSVK
jgi:hypothetical protein